MRPTRAGSGAAQRPHAFGQLLAPERPFVALAPFAFHHGRRRALDEPGVRQAPIESRQLPLERRKLAAVVVGDGTLLDHTIAVYGSEISDGDRHNHDDLPILVAGHVDSAEQGNREHPPRSAVASGADDVLSGPHDAPSAPTPQALTSIGSRSSSRTPRGAGRTWRT